MTLLGEPRRKRFHNKLAQLLYLGRRIRIGIMTAVAFLTTRITKAAEDGEGKLQRAFEFFNFIIM